MARQRGGRLRIPFLARLAGAALVLGSVLTAPAAAETPDPATWTETFMRTLIRDGERAAHAAMADLRFAGAGGQDRDISGFWANMAQAKAMYGRALGYERTSVREIGASLIVLDYYVKREKAPVFWKFIFYSPTPGDWLLLNFALRDRLPDLVSAR